ncbi:MAG: ribosome maturation factor RimP [Micrococcales bacterium]|nr:ribosome maturation factor RimP [Micrococcales bacterium]
MSIEDRLVDALQAPLAAADLLLEDAAVTPAGKRRVVRVAVDRVVDESDATTGATPPLTLDEVADATRIVSGVLDDTDLMGEAPYVLEVTSPGVDRPLSLPRHFRRNVGRLVTLTLAAGEKVTGRLVRADANGVTLDIPAEGKKPAGRRDAAYPEIDKASVQVEFNRPNDPAAPDVADADADATEPTTEEH